MRESRRVPCFSGWSTIWKPTSWTMAEQAAIGVQRVPTVVPNLARYGAGMAALALSSAPNTLEAMFDLWTAMSSMVVRVIEWIEPTLPLVSRFRFLSLRATRYHRTEEHTSEMQSLTRKL